MSDTVKIEEMGGELPHRNEQSFLHCIHWVEVNLKLKTKLSLETQTDKYIALPSLPTTSPA